MRMSFTGGFKKWLEKSFKDRVRFKEPMSKHTSFRIGGPADAFVLPETKEEFISLVKKAVENNVPWMVIGGGTNLVVKDNGIRGIVISTIKQKYTTSVETMAEDKINLKTSSGTKLSSLCRFAYEKGLQGMRFALGIPGTVGGAIVMNAGSSGGAMEDVLLSIDVMYQDGSIDTIPKSKFLFSYRGFGLKNGKGSRISEPPVILEAIVELQSGELESMKKEAKRILDERWSKQPTGFGNAGCFFKNPSSQNSAGKLIDLAGLKGYRVGGACVSDKHANFIINSGTATAADILELSEVIQKKVFQLFQIKLEPEVRVVG